MHCRVLIAGFFLVAMFAGSATIAEDRTASTPEERARFVAEAKKLEAHPLAEGARGARQALLEWIINVPDVMVKTCANMLSPIRGDDYPYAGIITFHEVLSAGIFAIEHPDEAQDDVAMYTAGVLGTLRAYELIVASDPDARHKFLDKLVDKRNSGTLTKYVAKIAKKCE